MVVAYLYGYIDKQTDGIDRHGDRHKDMENGDKREAIHSDAYLSRLVGWLVVGSVHFGSGWFDWFGLVHFVLVWFRFLTSHKKIF